VYFALGSICGNTFVNDAAASTVGTDPPALDDVELAGAAADVAAGGDDVELELGRLLPHAAASTETANAITTPETRRTEMNLITTTASLSARQNPGTLTESWQ
jgi:hypothetical protein